jgi:hypothetical protein
MLLFQRNPSINWEVLPLEQTGKIAIWVWYRPPASPYGLMFSVPGALFQTPSTASMLTVRRLVATAGIDQERILVWSVNGVTFDATGETSSFLDNPIPPVAPGMNQTVTVWIEPHPSMQFANPAPAMVAAPFPAQTPNYASASDAQLFEAVASSWDGILLLESRVSSLRKELNGVASRLNSLNRDLNSDERRAADSKDKQDWQDARRWLRDSLALLSRSMKEIDTGITSGAGSRHKFDDIYNTYIVTRKPFPGLSQAVIEFESHRKTVQNVVASAQASLAKAGRDAEMRAQSVLRNIASKVRSIRR